MTSKAVDRWLIRPARSGLIFGLVCAIAVYIGMCVGYAMDWSVELSPNLGLKVIRVFVIVLLTIPSLFVAPFNEGYEILNWILIITPFFGAFGFLYRLIHPNHSFANDNIPLIWIVFIFGGIIYAVYYFLVQNYL